MADNSLRARWLRGQKAHAEGVAPLGMRCQRCTRPATRQHGTLCAWHYRDARREARADWYAWRTDLPPHVIEALLRRGDVVRRWTRARLDRQEAA